MRTDMNKQNKAIRSYLLIAAGTGIMAFAIKSAYDPIGLVTGGFTGIGMRMGNTATCLSVCPARTPKSRITIRHGRTSSRTGRR